MTSSGTSNQQLNPRARAAERITRLGSWCFRRPGLTLAIVALIVGGLASQLPKVYFESELALHLDADHPVRVSFDAFREQYGRSDFAMVVLTPPEVFSPSFLTTLRGLHQRFEDELPWIEEVQSLVNARFTRGVGDTLVVGDLLEDWPETQAEIDAVREFALANPFYRDLYLSGDGKTVGIIVRPLVYEPSKTNALEGFEQDSGPEAASEFLSDAKLQELVIGVESILATSDLEGIEVHAAGESVFNFAIQQQISGDMARHSFYAFVVIGVLLCVVFRRLSAVVLPLLLVVVSICATLGAMGMLGRPLTFASQVVPAFILAVGTGFAVHVLAIFYQRLDAGDEPAVAVEAALQHSGVAIAMSSLTTAGGMLSFAAADLVSVRDIGLFVPFGALFSAALSLFALPALLAITPTRARASRGESPWVERVLVNCGLFSTRHPVAIPIVSVVILLGVGAGIPRIQDDYDVLTWFSEGSVPRNAIQYVDRTMGGASSLEVILDTGQENGLHNPDVLRRIDSIQRHSEANAAHGIRIQKTVSVTDVVKEIHQALGEGNPAAYTIDDNPRLIAQELLLFENSGSDDLEDIVDPQFQQARITLKSNLGGGNDYRHYLSDHEAAWRKLAGNAELTFTGYMVLGSTVSGLTMTTALRSYAIAFLLITPLMVLLIGSVRTGLISMAPNLMPILIVMGAMGWAGTPLDMLSALIGGIALGLVVDDTIHILYGFRREYERTGDIEKSTRHLMQSTGRALFFTTAVLASAFSVFAFSDVVPLANFGWLATLAIVLAFLFDVFLSPALLALVYRRR